MSHNVLVAEKQPWCMMCPEIYFGAKIGKVCD